MLQCYCIDIVMQVLSIFCTSINVTFLYTYILVRRSHYITLIFVTGITAVLKWRENIG